MSTLLLKSGLPQNRILILFISSGYIGWRVLSSICHPGKAVCNWRTRGRLYAAPTLTFICKTSLANPGKTV